MLGLKMLYQNVPSPRQKNYYKFSNSCVTFTVRVLLGERCISQLFDHYV